MIPFYLSPEVSINGGPRWGSNTATTFMTPSLHLGHCSGIKFIRS